MNQRLWGPMSLALLTACGTSNQDKALALLQAFESGDSAALELVSDTAYIQHNLSFPDGKEVLRGFFNDTPTGITVQTHRSFTDGDIVFLHSTYGGAWNEGVPQVGVDVFRFQDGLIVEHWDNLANVQDDNDGTTQVDGVIESTDLEQTEANRAVVKGAIQDLFLDGKWSTIETYFDLERYVQHSVGFGADAAGLRMVLGGLPEGTPFYSVNPYIYAEGSMVLTLSEGFPNEMTGLSDAYYDLFRLEDGKIVEHWDIIQTIPSMDAWANSNGKW